MTDAAQNTNTDPSQANVDDSPLNSLVGDGRKFKDANDLAKGKLESDKFIGTLSSENKELRELLAAAAAKNEELKRKADFIEGLTSTNQSSSGDGNQSTTTQQTAATPAKQGLTEADVFRLVETAGVQQKQADNLRAVNAALVKEFGATAKDVVAQRAAALGLPVEHFMDTATKSPEAFYALVGFQPNTGSRNSSLTSRVPGVNAAGMRNSGTDSTVRNSAFYESKKKEMGAIAFALDYNLQSQKHKDMTALGDAWD